MKTIITKTVPGARVVAYDPGDSDVYNYTFADDHGYASVEAEPGWVINCKHDNVVDIEYQI